MSLTITSNYHTRPVVYAYELTPKERATLYEAYGIVSDPEKKEFDMRRFVKAYGEYYDLDDVPRAPHNILAKGWDGFVAETFWGGVVFRYFDKEGYLLDGGDSVVVGYAHITG